MVFKKSGVRLGRGEGVAGTAVGFFLRGLLSSRPFAHVFWELLAARRGC